MTEKGFDLLGIHIAWMPAGTEIMNISEDPFAIGAFCGNCIMVVFFDNHANCDSRNYQEHEAKVAAFFKSGEMGKLNRENVRVFTSGNMACITAMLRYSLKPYPGVRTTYVVEFEDGSWRIRHMHHSCDPNEIASDE